MRNSNKDLEQHRLLKLSGLLKETTMYTPGGGSVPEYKAGQAYPDDIDTLRSIYSDLSKSVYGRRASYIEPENDNVEWLKNEIEYLRSQESDLGTEQNRTQENKTMKLTKSQLKRIISEEVSRVMGRQEISVLNSESGEVMDVNEIPDEMTSWEEEGMQAVSDVDFEILRKSNTLEPDDALRMLEDECELLDMPSMNDLGTAIDIAMGIKATHPKEWSTAKRSERIKDMYYADGEDGEEMQFTSMDDALARWLAERFG